MERIEYRTKNKSGWPRGEWDAEPDKIQWQDAETGMSCLIVRGGSGALCGYVAVTDTHPFYKKDYDSVPVEVHGGLTYADLCMDAAEDHGVCHRPGKGEPDNVWWFGFDCAHYGDHSPAYARDASDERYKSVSYVEAQVKSLARQLHTLMVA